MTMSCPVQGAALRRPDNFTVLHMRMRGEGASFKDLKGKTVTVNGNAVQVKTNGIFVGGCGYFDGSGDYLQLPVSTDFDFGTGDFTIEANINLPSVGSRYDIINMYKGNVTIRRILSFFINTGEQVQIQWFNSSGTLFEAVGNKFILANTKYNLVYKRIGTNFELYFDGILDASFTASGSSVVNTSDCPLRVGGIQGSSSFSYYYGYIGEVRVSKGVARTPSEFMITRRK
jgi:hypothetical protein